MTHNPAPPLQRTRRMEGSPMNISTTQPSNFKPTIGKFVMALAFASVMNGITISSALGQHNENRGRAVQDRGRNDERNQYDNRNRNDRRDQRAYRPQYGHPYRYEQPVYAPPPVYSYPEQRPGISLFFPLDFR
jgi:hypothetical protein